MIGNSEPSNMFSSTSRVQRHSCFISLNGAGSGGGGVGIKCQANATGVTMAQLR